MMRIIANWCSPPFRKALEGYGIKINVVRTSSILDILSRQETNHDLCYFAGFTSPRHVSFRYNLHKPSYGHISLYTYSLLTKHIKAVGFEILRTRGLFMP